MVIWLIVRDDPPGVRTEPHHETLKESLAGIWEVIRTPSMGRVFFAQVAIYPSYLLVAGLWGGPYLTHVYGYDLAGRGDILFLAALAQVLGSFLWGPTDRWFGSCKTPVLISMAGLFGTLLLFAAASPMPFPLLLIAFVLLGFFTGPLALVLTHGRLARRAASLRADHHAAQYRRDGRWIPGSVHQRRADRSAFRWTAELTLWRPTGWCSVFRRALVLIGFVIYFRSLDRYLGQKSGLH